MDVAGPVEFSKVDGYGEQEHKVVVGNGGIDIHHQADGGGRLAAGLPVAGYGGGKPAAIVVGRFIALVAMIKMIGRYPQRQRPAIVRKISNGTEVESGQQRRQFNHRRQVLL